MKKIMLALFGLLMLNNAANAQFRGGGGGDDEDGVISQGSHFFSLGYGVPSFVRKGVNTLEKKTEIIGFFINFIRNFY